MGGRSHSRTRARLSHVDADGAIRMVDVSEKPVTERVAVACGRITIGRAALASIRSGRVAKGDPLQAARLAGVMGAKRTAELIPLCHPLMLSKVDIQFFAKKDGYEIEASVGHIRDLAKKDLGVDIENSFKAFFNRQRTS